MNGATPRQIQVSELFEELGSLQAVVDQLGISYNAASKHLRQHRRLIGEIASYHRKPRADNDPSFTHITPKQQMYKDLFDRLGSQSAVARELGVSCVTVREKLIQYERNLQRDRGAQVLTLEEMQKGRVCQENRGRPSEVDLFGSNVHILFPKAFDPEPEPGDEEDDEAGQTFVWQRHIEPRRIPPPAHGVLRALITAAQDGTELHAPFWRNLEAYAEDLGAEIMVAGFTYNKSLFEDHAKGTAYFASELMPHMASNRVQFADALDFCGEMNTLPTAVNPLSGFHAYTEGRWGIFPHTKQALESIARMKHDPYKANMTTGACTRPNYVPKKAGLKAEFHHVIGCAIVEMTPDGNVWARHITADEETGSFRDLDVLVQDGRVTRGHHVEAIQFGDVHHEKLDPGVARATWGYDVAKGRVHKGWWKESLMGRLRPRHQFMHDLSDFAPRNHHNTKDHHFLFATWRQGVADVEHELRRCSRFLEETQQDDCRTVVVQSNHDNALVRWLKEGDFKTDQINAMFYLETQTAYYRAIQDEGREPPIFERVLRGFSKRKLKGIRFIAEDDSYVIAGGIECSQHGHLGPNGSRGSHVGLSKMSPRMNIGHGHSPQVRDGLWMAGVCNLEMGYNKGPSSWAIAHTITHVDGARQLVFMAADGRFHA